jgi:hypothetical protein
VILGSKFPFELTSLAMIIATLTGITYCGLFRKVEKSFGPGKLSIFELSHCIPEVFFVRIFPYFLDELDTPFFRRQVNFDFIETLVCCG